MNDDPVRVVLYTKPGCGLCEEMKHEMRRALIDHLYRLEEVNIETDKELSRRYRFDIPVLLVNGQLAFKHRCTAKEFRAYVVGVSKRSK